MMKIDPKFLNLTELLNQRVFYIPEYQRAYSWGSRERKDLFDDIDKVTNNSQREHFMATIVCFRRETIILGVKEFYKLEIVDGQQRLTTLIILLNAIKLSFDSRISKEKRIANYLGNLLVKEDSNDLLLLQTNQGTTFCFEKFLHKGRATNPLNAKTLAEKELLKAIEECQEFVALWKSSGRNLADLATVILNRLYFIYHETSDEGTVYTVFEVLNSRGMAVSWFDRLKSILMGTAFDLERVDNNRLIKDLRVIWSEIYRTIGLRQGLNTEALRFTATLWHTNQSYRPLSERISVDNLRQVAVNAKSIKEVAHKILNVTKACDVVLSNNRQRAVTKIAQARLLAVAIHLREDLDGADKEKLLYLWEKVTFRIYGMLRNDARTGVGKFVGLAWSIVNEELSYEDIYSGIKNIGADYPIEKAVEAIKISNCYDGWQPELRYFMFRYEEHLVQKKYGKKISKLQWNKIWESSAMDSIEHIFPQSNQSKAKIMHRLGNLLVLPPELNSSLKDKPPRLKFDAYKISGILIARKVAENSRWTVKAVEKRESELLDWAAIEWAVEQ